MNSKFTEFKIIKRLIYFFIIGSFFITIKGYAEETLQYELTPDKVERACVGQIKDGMKKGLYEVDIKLNEPNRKIFSTINWG